MHAIKEFKQLLQVEFYCWKVFFIEQEKLEALRDQLNTKKILIIQWATVAAWNFRGCYPVPSNPTYDFIVSLPNSCRDIAMWYLKDHEKVKKEIPAVKILAQYLKSHFKLSFWLDSHDKFTSLAEAVIYTLHEQYPNK